MAAKKPRAEAPQAPEEHHYSPTHHDHYGQDSDFAGDDWEAPEPSMQHRAETARENAKKRVEKRRYAVDARPLDSDGDAESQKQPVIKARRLCPFPDHVVAGSLGRLAYAATPSVPRGITASANPGYLYLPHMWACLAMSRAKGYTDVLAAPGVNGPFTTPFVASLDRDAAGVSESLRLQLVRCFVAVSCFALTYGYVDEDGEDWENVEAQYYNLTEMAVSLCEVVKNAAEKAKTRAQKK